MNNYVFYCIDTETSGLNPIKNDVIELSIYRLSDDVQKTWFIKPINPDNCDSAALRVNGHKLEDLKLQTKYGRDTYIDASKAIVEIENWLAEDNCSTSNRCLIGHNVNFDKLMIEHLWNKCNASDSFPFGRRYLDTMQLELAMDYIKDDFAEGYSLNNLSKKYSVKNYKAHSAEADTKCTVGVFKKQMEILKKTLFDQN